MLVLTFVSQTLVIAEVSHVSFNSSNLTGSGQSQKVPYTLRITFKTSCFSVMFLELTSWQETRFESLNLISLYNLYKPFQLLYNTVFPLFLSVSTFAHLLLPELQVLQELLHGHLVQEHEVRLAKLKAFQLRHLSLDGETSEWWLERLRKREGSTASR